MHDLIVIGSGGAGLAAALTAASCGSRVLALEASSRWGGSTSVSAGEVWVPANHLMPELGIPDSVEDALTYCLPYTSESAIRRVRTFLEAAPLMARLVEEFSPIVWRAMSSPDSFAEAPGGRASGRHLEVSPLMAEHASLLEKKFWMSSYPPIFTNDEVFESRLLIGGKFPQALADRRISAQSICTGVGLVHGLMQGCQDHGVEFERDARVVRLLRSKTARVCGVARTGHGALVRPSLPQPAPEPRHQRGHLGPRPRADPRRHPLHHQEPGTHLYPALRPEQCSSC